MYTHEREGKLTAVAQKYNSGRDDDFAGRYTVWAQLLASLLRTRQFCY